MNNITLTYNSQIDGAIAMAKVVSSLVDSFRNSGTFYSVNAGTSVTCTGYLYISDDGNAAWVQTTDGLYFYYTKNSSEWSLAEGAALKKKSAKDAQLLINRIISNNEHILKNNLICARFSEKLTSDQLQLLRDLQYRLTTRNDSLLNDQMCTIETTEAPEGYAELQAYLDKAMELQYDQAGVGSVTLAIVVSAIVIASLSTAAYFAYKYFADESDEDVRFSDELTRTLISKLTDEEYEMLREETKGIVTKARLKERLKSAGSRGLMIAAAIIFAGLLLKNRYRNG